MENESCHLSNDNISNSYKANDNESSNDQNTNKYNYSLSSNWSHLINLSKPHEPEESSAILETLQSIVNLYKSNVGRYILTSAINDFKALDYINNLNTSIENIFQTLQNEKKYYYFTLFIHILLTKILDQKKLSEGLKNAVDLNYVGDNYGLSRNYYKIDDSILLSDKSYSSSISIDENFNIYQQIRFNDSLSKDIRDHGKEILKGNYSKFISRLVDVENNNIIYIPFYSMCSISDLFYLTNHQVKFTLIEKVVIILETATALKDLHDNNKYHGTFYSSNVLLNSMKDAYITSFFYDENDENSSSLSKGQIYYRAPPNYYESVNDHIKKNQLNDIYSFGVFLVEVLTQKRPDLRFKKLARLQRLDILKGNNYFDFLFENEDDEEFKDDLKIFKEIVHECMKNDGNNSMDYIIGLIQKLPFYTQNKNEIESRIKMAVSGADYKCSLADLVECSFYDLSESKRIIIKILGLNYENNTFIQKNDDIIQEILENFQVSVDDVTYFFEDIFNIIIVNHEKELLEKIINNNCYVPNEKLYQLSMMENNRAYFGENCNINLNSIENGCVSIFSFTSIENFLKMDQGQSIIFTYLIAKEMDFIHSYDLYHGELSNESIGIYFNNKTKSFVPSIIPYYYYYCKTNNNENVFKKKKHQFNIDIEKLQKKDLKHFKNIIKNSPYFDLPKTVIDDIEESDSFSVVIFNLYNYIVKYKTDEFKNIFMNEIKNYQYSSFIVSYSNLIEALKNNEIIYKRIGSVLDDINSFLTECYSNPENSIINIMNKIQSYNKINYSNFELIKKTIQSIKVNCFNLYNEIIDQKEIDYTNINDLIIEKNGYLVIEFSPKEEIKKIQKRDKITFDIIKQKIENVDRPWFLKFINRRIELSELTVCSVKFLMRRYLCNLNPKKNYKIIVKIINKTYSAYQDFPIKADDIINIANELDYNDVKIEDGNVVIEIQRNK